MSFRTLGWAGACAALLLVFGCSESRAPSTASSAGGGTASTSTAGGGSSTATTASTGTTAGGGEHDGGGAVACNGRLCETGAECCPACPGYPNFCGSATAGCPVFDCVDTGCDPVEVYGSGFCRLVLGYAWTGTRCAPISGCECIGECGALFSDMGSCEAAHESCPSVAACGTRGTPPCGEGEYCRAQNDCFAADGPGVCVAQPSGCGDIFQPVCGCDGQTYGNPCEAASAGVSVEHGGECAR